ncbi:glycosyltransferase family 71 protein [Myriangium duriaei CBS 260.36]|uniref:Glycosyltransferase family 71 protein n=1 Tax=Myriangium duriaei CBS 260.36 TaxID=1168546 RepID=A0A9P4MCY3_9PEZI|nr:glycosyltransferase family 71 protein [Myriangium duriaei CBS 260.36]
MPKLESPPSSPSKRNDMFKYYARRRQPRWVRVLFAILIISFIYLLSINAIHPSSWAGEVSSGLKSKAGSLNAQQLGLNSHQKPKAPKVIAPDEEEQVPAPRKPKGKPKRPVEDEEEERNPRGHKSKGKTHSTLEELEDVDIKPSTDTEAGVEPKGEVDSHVDRGLKHIFDIAPDELHVRELLRPIENSGKERLRELGLRARAFRDLLEAWEDVHLVHTKTTTRVRDDIVNYLSKVKDLTAINAHKTRPEIIRSYENLRYFLTKLSGLLFPWTAPYFADHMTLHASIRHGGRGIVLSGGDGQVNYMVTSVRSIRKLGCNLPIEVMYLGDEDLGDDSRGELEALPGVITRDMKQMVRDDGWDLRGWAGKPFAMLLSSFREVIFIDADAMFFVSPETLFEDPGYEETGSLFFRDRLMFPESKRKWLQQILPKPMSRNVRTSRFWTGESGHMQESGVVVVDKWRHFMALLFVTRMNGPDRDGDKDKGIIGTYDMVYGDKETFWLGWELVGDHDYVFHPGEAGNMGVASEDYEEARKHVLGPIQAAEEEKKKKEKAEEEQKKREEEKRKEEEKRREEQQKQENEEKRLAEIRKKNEEEDKKREEAEKKKQAEAKAKREEEQRQKDEAEAKKRAENSKADKDKGENKQKLNPDVEDDDDDGEELPVKKAEQENEKTNKEPAKKTEEEKEKADKEPALRKRGLVEDEAPVKRKAKRALTDEEEAVALKDKDSTQARLDTTSESNVNYTICAPQLLHLDREGRPLWFNGWILDNKFDQDHPRLSTFESFMKERKEGKKEADWRLEENNLCCLQSDKIYSFTQAEKQALNNIVAIAKDVGALKQKK